MNENYLAVCERLDWTVREDEKYGEVEFQKHSPAGEDFSFSVDAGDLVEGVKEYAASFDQEEHIEMWIRARASGTSGIPSIKELVQDAEDIDKMLQELAAALWAAEMEVSVNV